MTNQDSPPERDVHAALNEPATDPDPTEWPDPYDKRPDPRDPGADDSGMDFGDVTHSYRRDEHERTAPRGRP